MEYPNQDWDNRLVRVEPEGAGKIYDVNFELRCPYGEIFAAMEGHGIGEKQWPNTPLRDGYEFVGWYDNLEWNGAPYTKDTPIHQDTNLYAKWKYSGPGGCWPRAHCGGVQGIDEGAGLSAGRKLTITVDGYNMNLTAPQDQRFRWIPMSWKLSDGTNGSFSAESPFQADVSLNNTGEHRLYITYAEEIFDGARWQATCQSREVEEVVFSVGE
jgi:uncharacterized repeat protein (TIGR02543 family)